ncbi:MAG: hypothetical protein AAFY88_07365 [Acidobacteriota bacterium]
MILLDDLQQQPIRYLQPRRLQSLTFTQKVVVVQVENLKPFPVDQVRAVLVRQTEERIELMLFTTVDARPWLVDWRQVKCAPTLLKGLSSRYPAQLFLYLLTESNPLLVTDQATVAVLAGAPPTLARDLDVLGALAAAALASPEGTPPTPGGAAATGSIGSSALTSGAATPTSSIGSPPQTGPAAEPPLVTASPSPRDEPPSGPVDGLEEEFDEEQYALLPKSAAPAEGREFFMGCLILYGIAEVLRVKPAAAWDLALMLPGLPSLMIFSGCFLAAKAYAGWTGHSLLMNRSRRAAAFWRLALTYFVIFLVLEVGLFWMLMGSTNSSSVALISRSNGKLQDYGVWLTFQNLVAASVGLLWWNHWRRQELELRDAKPYGEDDEDGELL